MYGYCNHCRFGGRDNSCIGNHFSGGNVGIFINIPSAVMVFGGTIAATLINFPLSDVLSVFNTVKNSFIQKATSTEQLIEKLVEFATVARREGILALESQAADAGDEFLQKSVQLAIDGTAPELIKDILTTEIAFMEDRHSMGKTSFWLWRLCAGFWDDRHTDRFGANVGNPG